MKRERFLDQVIVDKDRQGNASNKKDLLQIKQKHKSKKILLDQVCVQPTQELVPEVP